MGKVRSRRPQVECSDSGSPHINPPSHLKGRDE
jgi:hypothetical protein